MMTKTRQTNIYTHNRRDADAYDAGGRVTRTVNGRGQLLDLAWNLQGELVSVSTNGVFAEGYAYDPMGRRIATTDNSGTVYHAYDGIHCVADLAPDGTLLRSYTWGSGVDIKRAQSPRRSRRATAILSPSRRDGARSGIPRRSGNCYLLAVTLYSATETNTLYAVTDPLGTVHALVGTNGVPAVTYAYDSWGNLLSVSGDESLVPSLRFTWQGREYSHATALYSFRARWYDPAAGRWLSKDPIGLEGGLNLYEAFGNNPVCFRDPRGLDWFSTWGKAIADGAGAVGDAAVAVGNACADAAVAVGDAAAVAGKFSLDVVGKTWGGVNTAVGLVAGGIFAGGFSPWGGAKVSFGNNAIQFEDVWFMQWGSITLGNCILYESNYSGVEQSERDEISCHEKQHTYQSQVLGPLYLPAHLIFGTSAFLFNSRNWHGPLNILETGPQSNPPRPWP